MSRFDVVGESDGTNINSMEFIAYLSLCTSRPRVAAHFFHTKKGPELLHSLLYLLLQVSNNSNSHNNCKNYSEEKQRERTKRGKK